MKGHLRRDDLRLRSALLIPVPASELDRTFVGLRAGVGEEDLIGETDFYEFFCQHGLRLIVVVVAAVDDLFCLIRDRLYQRRIAVTQNVNSDTADHVHILLAVCSIEIYAFSVVNHEGDTFPEHRHIIFFIIVNDLC